MKAMRNTDTRNSALPLRYRKEIDSNDVEATVCEHGQKSCIERSFRFQIRTGRLSNNMAILGAPIFRFLHTFVGIKQNELTVHMKSRELGMFTGGSTPLDMTFA